MNTLRKRLAGLYTVTTGLLFLLVIAAFLTFSVWEARTARIERFRIIWDSLSLRFQSSSAFSHGFLAQTEADYHLIIHIRENGIPFLYPGSWQPDTDREILIRRAAEQAEGEGIFFDRAPVSASADISSLMTIEGEHKDRYYARILVLPTGHGTKSICTISYIPPIYRTLRRTILYLCLLALLGIGCLWLISWKFVGWSLRPVEESQKKQAQFIAAASHELRSPLAILRSGISALASSPSRQQDFPSAHAPNSHSPCGADIDSSCGRDSYSSYGLNIYSSYNPDTHSSYGQNTYPACDPDTHPACDSDTYPACDSDTHPACDSDAKKRSPANRTPQSKRFFDSDRDSLLPLLESECARMARLVDDMLLLASADAKTWTVRQENVEMDTLLIDIYEAFLPLCREKGISLSLDLPDDPLPAVIGDKERLFQLFSILMDNANNYTPAGRSVTLSARIKPASRTLSVRVTDEGCGIPPEIRPLIFDRFYRADSARRDKQHFGLGLSIAKELALLHRGDIALSNGEKGGSCFTVTLPWGR